MGISDSTGSTVTTPAPSGVVATVVDAAEGSAEAPPEGDAPPTLASNALAPIMVPR